METDQTHTNSARSSMETNITKRTDVIEAIRNRVCAAMGFTLTSHEAVAVSLAATAPRDREAVFGMLLNNMQAKIAARSPDSVAPTDTEWEFIFGKADMTVRDGGLGNFTNETTFSEYHKQLEAALRCSLVEEQSKVAWAKPLTKAACYLALHSEDTESRVAACLGGIVRADSRRLDDVRSTVEDGEVDHMLLAKVVLSIATSIVP